MKHVILLTFLFALFGCASSNELAGLSPCEQVPVLEARYDAYVASRDGVLTADAQGVTERSHMDNMQRWRQRIKEAQDDLQEARESCASSQVAVQDRFPAEYLPESISIFHEGGERPDWSLDGKWLAFMTEEGGDVKEKNFATGEVRDLTAHYDLGDFSKYYRVMYMADGNVLLTGGPERYGAYMQILDPSQNDEPHVTDVMVIEGPAVSRLTLPVKIAYCPDGQDKIRLATLRYTEDGTPYLEDDRLVIDGHDLPPEEGVAYSGMIEPQNWRGPEEKELIFSRYSWSEEAGFLSETWGWHSETGELINYSNLPDYYAEPEGIFPDGESTLIESDLDDGRGVSHLDLYSLKLDGSGETKRLTHFAEVGAWKANNGVVSPDGRYVAFQESQGGFGQGWGRIYLLDLQAAARERK